jgi:hypothetical protein
VDADQKGIPFPGLGPGWRRLEVSPLQVYFIVSEPDRMVSIREYVLKAIKP